MRRILTVLVLSLIFLVGISQAAFLNSSNAGSTISLSSASESVNYIDNQDGLSFSHYTLIDGGAQSPGYVGPSVSSTSWGTGSNAATSDILMSYAYNSTGALKGTIVLKSRHAITFPYTLSSNEQILPYEGGFRIVNNGADYSQGFPAGIVIPAPTAIDANGSTVQVSFSLDPVNQTISLVIPQNDSNLQPISYPLTVDPSYYLGAYVSYLKLLLHFNSSNQDLAGHAMTTAGSFAYNTVSPMFGSASGSSSAIANNIHSNSGSADFMPTSGTAWTVMIWVDMTSTMGSDTNIAGPATAGTIANLGWQIDRAATNRPNLLITNASAVALNTQYTSGPQVYNNIPTEIVGELFPNLTFMMWVNGTQELGSYAAAPGAFATTPNQIFAPETRTDLTAFAGTMDEETIWYGVNIPISQLYPLTNEVNSQTSNVSFTSNVTQTTATTLAVQFNDTSSGLPNKWDWGFGDGSANSTLQNPSHLYTTSGIYSIYLNTTNTTGGYSTIGYFPNYIHVGLPGGTFSGTPTTGISPFQVQFTDQSTNSPNSWNWSFGEGNYSIVQNPNYNYVVPGTYQVNLSVGNAIGNSTLTRSSYIVVRPSGYPVPNFTVSTTTGTPGVLIAFTDSSVTINGTSIVYNWSFGDSAGTQPLSSTVGSVSHVYAYAGIFTPQLTITDSQGSATYVGPSITVSTNQGAQNVWYTPMQVRFTLDNQLQTPLVGLMVSATPLNNTFPSNWQQLLFGINPSVQFSGTTVYGLSGGDGSISFPMFQSLGYSLKVNGTASNGQVVNLNGIVVYPQQSDILLTIPYNVINENSAQNNVSYSMTNATVDSTHELINLSYIDTTAGTTALTFYVQDQNGTYYYQNTYTGGAANSETISQLITHPLGTQITYGWYANQSSLGTISDYSVVSYNGVWSLSGTGTVGWQEQWIAIAIIVIVGCVAAGYMSWVLIIAELLLCYFFTFIAGWCQPKIGLPAMGACLAFLLVAAILMYIRSHEKRTEQQ